MPAGKLEDANPFGQRVIGAAKNSKYSTHDFESKNLKAKENLEVLEARRKRTHVRVMAVRKEQAVLRFSAATSIYSSRSSIG